MGWKNARFTSLYQHITIVFFLVLLFYLFLYNIFRQRQLFILFQFSPSLQLSAEKRRMKKLSFSNSHNGSWAKHKHASYQFLILFSNKQKCSLKNWMYCFGIMMEKFRPELEVYSILWRVELTFSFKIWVNFEFWFGLIY